MATPDTRQAILDAAERLFAEQGIEPTSLRTITSVAQVNLAAVHYHFGSKEKLIGEVFSRRIEPINKQRLERLDAAESDAGDGPVPTETILRCFLEPVFQMDWSREGDGPDVSRLMGRLYVESQEVLEEMTVQHFQVIAARFGGALAKALPHHSAAELFWRFHFLVGSMAHTLQCNVDLKPFAFDKNMEMGVAGALEPLVRFGVAALEHRGPQEAGPGDRSRRKGRLRTGLLGAVASLGFAACGSPDVKMPEHGIETPEAWQAETELGAAEDSTEALLAWWHTFEDARLEQAVEECLANNRDLRATAARVEAAGHQARIAGADLYPQASVGLDGSRQRQVFIGFPFGGGGVPSSTFESYGLNLNLTWELDVWGRVRSGEAAALADAEAAAWDFAAARLSLVGQTCKVWFAHVAARLQRDVAAETVRSFEETLETVNQRFQSGLSPALDVRQAERDLATARSNLAARKETLERTVRQLEALLGRYPKGLLESGPDLPTAYAPVPAGLPAELLSRRPDLRSAERRLAAADQRLEQSRAAMLPRLSLSAGGGTNTAEFSDVLDDDFRVWNIAGNLLQPIFQGGRLMADVDRNEAEVRAVVADYSAVLLQAFSEVEQAMAAERHLQEQETQLAAGVGHAKEALGLAQERYSQGLTDFLSVSINQQAWLVAQAELLSVRQARLDRRVDLYLALGGGFPPPPELDDEADADDTAPGQPPEEQQLASQEVAR